MTKVGNYRELLRALDGWDSFLLKESGLPGPRANLELAQAVAEEGDEPLFRRFLSLDPEQAPANSPHGFLGVCGAIGLGRLLRDGKTEVWPALRRCASDPRWRIREAVAIGLQLQGDRDVGILLREMEGWSQGSLLEKRAAIAALCEPSLLRNEEQVRAVLRLLDKVTESLLAVENRKSAEFEALKKGLGYCWSVAVAALPEDGKRAMEKWLCVDDKDVRWIMRENLKKNRLARMDAAWIQRWRAHAVHE